MTKAGFEFWISVIVICLVFVFCYLELPIIRHSIILRAKYHTSSAIEKHTLNPFDPQIQQCDIIFKRRIHDPGVYLKIIQLTLILNLRSEIIQIIKRGMKQVAGFNVQRSRDQPVFQTDNLHKLVIVFIIDGNPLFINPLPQGPGFALFKAKAMRFP